MTKRFPQADFSLVADIPRGVRFTLGQLERYDISAVHWMAERGWIKPGRALPLTKTGERHRSLPYELSELGEKARKAVWTLKNGVKLSDFVPPTRLNHPWTDGWIAPLKKPWENWITNGHLACKMDLPIGKNINVKKTPLSFDHIHHSFLTGSVHGVKGQPRPGNTQTPVDAQPFAVCMGVNYGEGGTVIFHETGLQRRVLEDGVAMHYFFWFHRQFGKNLQWKCNPYNLISGIYKEGELIGILGMQRGWWRAKDFSKLL